MQMCRYANERILINLKSVCKFENLHIELSTGTRIRTQIKGFGDPYATVAPCPCVIGPVSRKRRDRVRRKAKAIPVLAEQLL